MTHPGSESQNQHPNKKSTTTPQEFPRIPQEFPENSSHHSRHAIPELAGGAPGGGRRGVALRDLPMQHVQGTGPGASVLGVRSVDEPFGDTDRSWSDGGFFWGFFFVIQFLGNPNFWVG